MSQPSASARVRQLERQLDVTLLRRGPTGSVPTDAGRLVAEWATEVLEAAGRLEAGVASLRAASSPPLRLAASLTVAEHLLPGWLAQLRSPASGEVALEVANSQRVLEAVAGGRAQLGFIESPGPIGGLPSAEVGTDELVVVASPGHPWARRRTPLPAALLAAEPLVTREPGSGTRAALEAAMAEAGLAPASPAAELGSTAAVKGWLLAGGGAGVLSRRAVEPELRLRTLVEVKVAGVGLRRRLRAVWPAPGPPEGPAAALLAVARGR